MKLLRHIITIVCLVATFIANAGEQLTANAKCVVNQPTNAELQLLQGTWEEVVVGDKETSKNPDFQKSSERKPFEIDLDVLSTGIVGSPPKSPEKVTITITGNSLHFHRDTNFWFETTFTLPAGTDPKQLHATIKGCPPSQTDSIGQVVGAIFKIEDGTLTLADYAISAEPPKSFSSASSLRVLKKVQPQKKNTEPPKTK